MGTLLLPDLQFLAADDVEVEPVRVIAVVDAEFNLILSLFRNKSVR